MPAFFLPEISLGGRLSAGDKFAGGEALKV